jgi:SAM-dependent MidA family methyltransferase
VSDYKLKHYPYEDFIIYEMGAGNGTLMCNIMDYLRDEEPEVYERTQ